MEKIFPYIVVIIFSLLSVFSLFKPGLPPTHDGEYHIVRFGQFDKTLRDGQLYPRWQPDLNFGYGSPLLNYYYPLPNYMASFLHTLGISFIDSFKIEMIIATIIGAVFFFLWSRIVWGTIGGIVASIFYTYTPYHFVDIFVRGSVGEIWSLSWFPAVLWSFTKFMNSNKKIYLHLCTIFLSLVIFSHNILAYMFFLFFISYVIFMVFLKKGSNIQTVSPAILLSLGITAIFWIPALFEQEYVRGLQIFDIYPHFPEIYQLLFPSWGTGFSAGDIGSQMSFQIGVSNLFSIFVSSVLVTFNLKSYRNIVLFFLLWFFIAFILMTQWSYPIWKHLLFLDYFQFPWRLLSLTMIISSFLIGSVFRVKFFTKKKYLFASITVCLVVLPYLLTRNYSVPAYYHNREDSYYFSRSNFMDGTNTPGNAFNTTWFNADHQRQQEKISIDKKKGKVIKSDISSIRYNFLLDLKEDTKIRINTAYFPGWEALIDGLKVKIDVDKYGLIEIDVPKSSKVLTVIFRNTMIRNISTLVTLVSIIIMSGLLFKEFKKVI